MIQEQNKPKMMQVMIDGCTVQRNIDRIETSGDGKRSRAVPELRPGERVMHVVAGPPVIVRGPVGSAG